MNINKTQAIQTLRKQNYSYACIAKQLGMNMNTVKSICRRSGITTPDLPRKTKAEKQSLQICKQCGKPIDNPWNRSRKQFCSDKCRLDHWNTNKIKAQENSGKKAPAIPAKAKASNNITQKSLDSLPHQSYDGDQEVTAYGS